MILDLGFGVVYPPWWPSAFRVLDYSDRAGSLWPVRASEGISPQGERGNATLPTAIATQTGERQPRRARHWH
jgi:hypothetical protein